MSYVYSNGGIIGKTMDIGSDTNNSGAWAMTSVYENLNIGFIPMPLGLSPVLFSISNANDAWIPHSIDLTSYIGHTVRFVWEHQAGGSYLGDVQIDLVEYNNGSSNSFESDAEGYETTTSATTNYLGASFSGVATATTAARWNRDANGTPSNGTGRSDAADGSFYIYSETSNPSGGTRWLRSQPVLITDANFSFYEARAGSDADINVLNFYVDVVSAG